MMKSRSRYFKIAVLLFASVLLLGCALPKVFSPQTNSISSESIPATTAPTAVLVSPIPEPNVSAAAQPAIEPVSGTWQGTLTENSGIKRNYSLKAEFKASGGENSFSGTVELIQGSAEGGETYPVEGKLVGTTIHFSEPQGRFFSGVIAGDQITGQVAWNCFDCDGWGQFNLTRGSKIVAIPTPVIPNIPADLPFNIDCSALPADRKADCDAFIIATRDQVYPLMREITGVKLSDCYDQVAYTILPGDPAPGAGGFSAGKKITYAKTYSIDLPHKYDVHELLHTVSACTKALDAHVFHGMVLNDVYDRLGVHDSGYFTDKGNPNGLNDYLFEKIKTSSGTELQDQCRGVLSNKMTIAYFDLGNKATTKIYRSTINPHPASAPGTKLVEIWGPEAANQVQALLETLKNDYQYSLDVPACGY